VTIGEIEPYLFDYLCPVHLTLSLLMSYIYGALTATGTIKVNNELERIRNKVFVT